jgi:hypothetical protein
MRASRLGSEVPIAPRSRPLELAGIAGITPTSGGARACHQRSAVLQPPLWSRRRLHSYSGLKMRPTIQPATSIFEFVPWINSW